MVSSLKSTIQIPAQTGPQSASKAPSQVSQSADFPNPQQPGVTPPHSRSKAERPARAEPTPRIFKPLPPIEFPEQLPVSARREEILRAIQENSVVIVCGETGSGKTTQLPKIVALAGCGQSGLIGHTQPRRIAAHSVAKRIAEELGSPLGEHVGYKVRFNETMQAGASIKLMTDGILLAETLSDPYLRAYDCIIIDEAHERSLNIDFLLGYLKRLLNGPRQHDLKVIVTSATIDAERFAQHFAQAGKAAPVIEVSGRVFPVEVIYRPHEADEEENDLPTRIEEAIDELWRKGSGDVLVFLPGEREIRDVADHLRRMLVLNRSRTSEAYGGGRPGGPVEILPLFSRLSATDQQKIFSPGNGRRVVLATNVAETSLTVPGIRYVVDAGVARIKRYLFRAKIEQLLIEPISQASANQRSGRCGRVSDGVCIRLYAEADFLKRPRFTEPELLRSSLASVILRMKALKLGEIDDFPFVEAPQRRAIVDGLALLDELHALEENGQLSAIGREMARLPLDPKASRMLIAARELNCVPEVMIIASAMASQDPRDRPMDRQAAADEKHRRFADERGDFLSFVKIWDYWQNQQRDKESHNKLAAKMSQEFLSVRKLREWHDVHAQLRDAFQALAEKTSETRGRVSRGATQDVASSKALNISQAPLSDETVAAKKAEAILKALLTGLLGNLGTKSPEDSHYQGTHQTRFVIHPSSALIKKQPKWLMANEMVDTGRLYARNVARIDPQWVESAASHLIKRSWSEPTWSKNSGQVVAFESGMLYGLILYSQRRVPYADKDPKLARELLIKQALVEGDWIAGHAARHLPFLENNRQLVAEVRKLEDKIRRPDLLVDEQTLFEWFDAQLPQDIVSGKRLEQWYALASKQNPQVLKLSKDVLLKKESDGIAQERFPKTMKMRSAEFSLDYKFDPGSKDDGVSITVPISLLNQVDATACEWLVPGLLQDKAEALIKSLPQRHRRHMVPVKAFAQDFCQAQWQPVSAETTRHAFESRNSAQASLEGEGEGEHGHFAGQSEFQRQQARLRSELRRGKGLVEAIIDFCRERLQVRLLSSDFKLETVSAHLLMNFKLVDEHARYLSESRMLAQLKADFGGFAQTSFQNAQRSDNPFAALKPALSGAPGNVLAKSAKDYSVVLKASVSLSGSSGTHTGPNTGANVQVTQDSKSVQSSALQQVGGIKSGKGASQGPHASGQYYQAWTFGPLPELMELEVNSPIGRQTAVGFPGLKDLGESCELQVFDDERTAAKVHRQGLRRLFLIALREPIKFFERNIPELTKMGLIFTSLGSQEDLKAQLVAAMIDRACLKKPWPNSQESFEQSIAQARPRLNLVGQETARSAYAILSQWQNTQKKFSSMRAQLPKEMQADLDTQLGSLVFKQFMTELPDAQVKHVPRYLEAVFIRLDKWRGDPARDAALAREIAPLVQQFRRLQQDLRDQNDPRLEDLRWMLEELRVSLFAQQLKTAMPVSVKRVQKTLAAIQF
jgi:ATP-dependent helicase HrpA